MAARKNRFHDPKTIAQIQTTQLIKRLQEHAFSDDEKAWPSSRMKAIEILLKKTVPDLLATEMSGDPENPIAVTAIERNIIDPKNEAPDSNS